MQLGWWARVRRRWAPIMIGGRQAAVVLLAAAAAAACSASDPPTNNQASATTAPRPGVVAVPTTTAGQPAAAVAAGLRSAAAGLCAARRDAGDPGAARRVFYDRSHERLHDLARAVERVDRAGAARLLEAKETVEADLDQRVGAARLSEDLDRLIGATGAALRKLSIAPPSCAG